jgi:hypothetical protein
VLIARFDCDGLSSGCINYPRRMSGAKCVVVPVDGPMECCAECGDPGPASGPRSACWLAASRVMPVLGRCVASRGPPGPDAAVINFCVM